MKPLTQWLRHAAEGVAAAMLVALFAVFLVQIAARYVFNVPMGWTVEVCLTLWLWIVFWGGAFCLRPADHIRFDVLYLSVNRPTQRIFGAIAAVMIVAAFASQRPERSQHTTIQIVLDWPGHRQRTLARTQ